MGDANSPTSVNVLPVVDESCLWVSLKSSTKNPDLNLSRLSTSLTWNVLVSSSNKDKEVITSRFSILSSSLPMSLIVYLLLSTTFITASSVL